MPDDFPATVLAETRARIARGPELPPGAPTAPVDRTDLPFITIDPAGSRDLDQAVAAGRSGAGYRVHYAIADVAAFVRAGGAIDAEARERGVTRYCPDMRAPLHPNQLNEDAASLMPDRDRWAVLWTIDLDAAGDLREVGVERAVVRSRRALSYTEAQAELDAGRADPGLVAVAEIGARRQAIEIARGGVSLELASQEIVRVGDGYRLTYDRPLPIEDHNAQVSLLTGMAAARLMLDGGVGLLRTLPPPGPEVIDRLRTTALALGLAWPAGRGYPDFVRGLDPSAPLDAAMMAQAARALRGAGYQDFNAAPPALDRHWAIAASYAHVTAPLRRLADRYANEIVLALAAGREPPEWALEALPELPKRMGRAHSAERTLEAAIVDFVEAALLRDRVGQEFTAIVIDVDADEGRARLQITEPAVVATMDADGLSLGDRVVVRLVEADPQARRVRFTPA